MKTIILTLTAVLVTIAASAQTSFTTSKLAIAADDGGLEFDLTDSTEKASIVLNLVEGGDTIISFGDIIRSFNGTYSFPGSVIRYYTTMSMSDYTLTTGNTYKIEYLFPSIFEFKMKCNNPYNYFRVRIFGADSSGNICFKQTIGTVWDTIDLVQGSHWRCYGHDTSIRDGGSCTFTLSDDVNEWTGNAADVVECFLCLSFGAY